MSRRRKAREIALQTLYAQEVSGTDWKTAFDDNVERRKPSEEVVEYAERLVTNVMEEKANLDSLIRERLENWALERVSVVDRTILRIALSELLHCPEVPANVIMDEAIEIAQKFSSADAGRFVNGVLDRLAREVRER
jgi:transcription antitermination protein NusB